MIISSWHHKTSIIISKLESWLIPHSKVLNLLLNFFQYFQCLCTCLEQFTELLTLSCGMTPGQCFTGPNYLSIHSLGSYGNSIFVNRRVHRIRWNPASLMRILLCWLGHRQPTFTKKYKLPALNCIITTIYFSSWFPQDGLWIWTTELFQKMQRILEIQLDVSQVFSSCFTEKHNGPLCCHLYQNKVDENSTSPEGKRFP